MTFELEKQAVTAELGLELLEIVRQLGVLVLPFRDVHRETQRNQFVESFREWASQHQFHALLGALANHKRQARLCEPVFRLILDNLRDCPTGNLPPELAVWSVVVGVAKDATEVFAATSSLKLSTIGTNTVYLSAESLRVKVFNRDGIDPDSVAERYAANLSGYLKMLGHEHGWFQGNKLILPRITSIPDEVSGDRSAMYLAEIWNQFEEHWGKVRYFPTSDVHLLPVSEPNMPNTLAFKHDQEFFLDIEVARSRLRRQAFEISMNVIYSPKIRPLIGDPEMKNLALAPSQFISVVEAVSMMILDICYELNIRSEKRAHLGLTLAQWLRGYGLLQLCAKTGRCIEPIGAGIGKLDRIAFVRIAGNAGIPSDACEKFLQHVTFGPKSRDLWDAPLLLDGDGELIIITSLMQNCALAEALISRLNSLLQQIKSKGPKFEADVQSLYEDLGAKSEQFKYRAESGIYECDIAALWSDFLFLNECKAYVLPQPAAEDLYFFKLKQQDAVDQIRRVARQLKQYPDILGRHFQQASNASVTVPCVMNQAPFWTRFFGDEVQFFDRGALAKFCSGSIGAVIRSATSDEDSPVAEAEIHSLWSGDVATPQDLLAQMANPYQYEKELSMWRLSVNEITVGEELILHLPILFRLPDPSPRDRDS